jgi:hypothetical protein
MENSFRPPWLLLDFARGHNEGIYHLKVGRHVTSHLKTKGLEFAEVGRHVTSHLKTKGLEFTLFHIDNEL